MSSLIQVSNCRLAVGYSPRERRESDSLVSAHEASQSYLSAWRVQLAGEFLSIKLTPCKVCYGWNHTESEDLQKGRKSAEGF